MSALVLDCSNASKVRQAVADEDLNALRAIPFNEISIGACIEMCCACHEWRTANNQCGLETFQRLASEMPMLAATYERLACAIHHPGQSRFQAGGGELVLSAVAQKRAFQERAWIDFQQGLVEQLKICGFQPSFANALSAAFGEIAENVPDHSAEDDAEMAAALVGYFAAPGEIHFAVGDLGRGVLASLHENPQWADLRDSRHAILATLEQGATRKREHAEGTGLKLALKSFVDRNGILSLRSGDATAHVGRDSTSRRTISGFAPPLSGTCVAASCFARGFPEEKPCPKFIFDSRERVSDKAV
jgi:hypothetical protein